jgi:Tfp pilus assembly protein PilF
LSPLKVIRAGSLALCLAGCTQWQIDRTGELNRDGVAALNQNDLNQAHAKFVESWKLQPQNADTLYNLATTYHQHRENALAEQYYQQALSVNPNLIECRHNYHLLLVSENRSAAASGDALRWMESHPRSPEALAEVGWLSRLRGDLPTAKTHLEQALALEPNNTQALLEMGKLYESYRMPERAKGLYQRVLSQDPKHPEANALLASLSQSTSVGQGP